MEGMPRRQQPSLGWGGVMRKLEANSMRDLIQPSKSVAMSLPHSSGKARVFHFGCVVPVGSTRELEQGWVLRLDL